jgi:membrane-associated protease RseP (regulator of RpoE activity)
MSLLDLFFDSRVLLFYTGLFALIYFNRSRFSKEGIMYLLKTHFGLDIMDATSRKFRKPLIYIGYFGVLVAYLGFFFITYLIIRNAIDILVSKPGVAGASPIIPGLPVAGLGIVFPLIIGWISLFIIMIVHEFSHGVIARAHKIRVKSSGLAFIGPIPGAFVEIDEKQLAKMPHRVQHSVFAAGPFSNIVLYFVCIVMLIGVVQVIDYTTVGNGVIISPIQNQSFPAYNSGLPENTVITSLNNQKITTVESLEAAIDNLTVGQSVVLESESGKTFEFNTIKNPDKASAYLGILLMGENRTPRVLYNILSWIFELLWWTQLISFAVGLVNLFPIFITDGARMLKLNCDFVYKKNKKKAENLWKNLSIFALILFLILLIPLVKDILQFFLDKIQLLFNIMT